MLEEYKEAKKRVETLRKWNQYIVDPGVDKVDVRVGPLHILTGIYGDSSMRRPPASVRDAIHDAMQDRRVLIFASQLAEKEAEKYLSVVEEKLRGDAQELLALLDKDADA